MRFKVRVAIWQRWARCQIATRFKCPLIALQSFKCISFYLIMYKLETPDCNITYSQTDRSHFKERCFLATPLEN